MRKAQAYIRAIQLIGHLKSPRVPSMMSAGSIRASSNNALASKNDKSNGNEGDIIVSDFNEKRVISLNRPKALNALSLTMIRKMYPCVKNFDGKMLIFKAEGGKSFCAGGDVRSITEAGKKGEPLAQNFFREEYTLNYTIGKLKMPLVSLIDGVYMGGGVGISVHGPYRVATERTLFAMPETAIGLFPDVGGSYFLPRLDGKLGVFLALTGARLRGRDCLEAKIATHYVDSKLLRDLEQALLAIKSNDISKANIERVLSDFQKQSIPKNDTYVYNLKSHLSKIDKLFSGNSVEQIFENLEKDGSEWAKAQLETLKKMSPTSMKVSLRQLEYGAKSTFKQCFEMEYRMSQHFIADHDFYEGVRAILVDKDNKPRWKPPTLAEVTEAKVEWFFQALKPPAQELVLPE